MNHVHLVSHPLISHSLTILRDKHTGTDAFRHHTAIVSQIMIMEATKGLPLQKKSIETPMANAPGYEIEQSIVFAPVLRAGISMLFSARDFLPWAPVGFIGLERDEKTAIAREYYQKFPADVKDKLVLVLDPMLATGGSLDDTISALKRKGAQTISAVCIVAAPKNTRR